MDAVSVLFAGGIGHNAYEKRFNGDSAFSLAIKKAASFKHTVKTVLLIDENTIKEAIPQEIAPKTICKDCWNVQNLLETLAEEANGLDFIYFAWADCPFLDEETAEKLSERHIRYAADYSYADGWPAGLSPELLSPSTPVFLAKINAGAEDSVKRDSIFDVLQKDINSFDIEVEISPTDLRQYRLLLAADSKRNLLLLERFWSEGFKNIGDAGRIISEKPELLRTLPAFYPIQVSGICPQKCVYCPFSKQEQKNTYMDPKNFSILLDKITEFSGDAVISLSLWGEIALHPQKLSLINDVLRRKELSLVIESSGLGWKDSELNEIKAAADMALERTNKMPALSFIVSLDSINSDEYARIRGEGFDEAFAAAKKIAEIFGKNAYIQAMRFKGTETEIEKFYRFWNSANVKTIIQKYDDFCGKEPDLRAADFSPVQRHPCWHIMRDMPILIDGSVPQCRETSFEQRKGLNVFSDTLQDIWQDGRTLYAEHCNKTYLNLCNDCDEYWTYNF
ncbi:MAG: spiro-SPASM protein [Spirochaetaceae bacterium]|jgi:spiro-SPASM protein|nr:spiro-SPASM protein [Spirochaetaceae bacterium]